MSSFLKRGKRIQVRKDKKAVKHHTKEFYKIIGTLEEVAELMKKDESIMKVLTEDNMVELAGKYTKIELGNLEKFILKGKLGLYHSLNGDIEKAKDDGKDNDK